MIDCNDCALARDVNNLAEEVAELRLENHRLLNELNSAHSRAHHATLPPDLIGGCGGGGDACGGCGNCGETNV